MPIDLTIGADAALETFGEPVTVTAPSIEGGRSIVAIIDRDPPVADFEVAPGTRRPRAQVHVVNDAALGIAAGELDINTFQLSFPTRIGAQPTPHPIASLVRQDAGWLVLETS